MIPIAKPNFNVEEVFIACISTVDNAIHKKALEDCLETLIEAEEIFNQNFEEFKIHEITPKKIVFGKVDSAAMKVVYDYRMVRQGMPGHGYYDKLKMAASYGKCPLCSVKDVDTLDHYLPKALFPVYAVTPLTLVPACTRCNKGKHISYPNSEKEQTLHPYYDNIDDFNWLKAEIIKTSPITFNFFIEDEADAAWSQLLKDRVLSHFNAFTLNPLFTSHANEEYRGAERQLKNLFNKHPNLLIDHLKETYDSKLALGRNSWQAATYNALLSDQWFCDGNAF